MAMGLDSLLKIREIRKLLELNWPGLTKFGIWIIGLLILSTMAFKEFYPMVDEYRNVDRNIGTHVWVKNERGRNVSLPPATLCIPRSFSLVLDTIKKLSQLIDSNDSRCALCDEMNARSWNIFQRDTFEKIKDLDKDGMIRYYHSEILVPLINKLIYNDSDDFEALRLENFAWNQLLVHGVWDVLNCVFTYDRQFNVSEHAFMDWCEQNNHAIDFLVSNKSRVEKLFYRFVDILCDHISYSDLAAGRRPTKWPKAFCIQALHKNHSAVFYNNFCLTLPMNGTSLTAVVDAFGSNGYWTALDNSAFFPSKFHANFHVFSRTGEVFSRDYLLLYYGLYESSDIAETVNIQVTLPFTVLEERENVPCYGHFSRSECKNKCVINALANACDCVPFTLRTFAKRRSADLAYCQPSRYEKCGFDKMKIQKECDAQCNHPCHYIPYQWMVSRSPLILPPERRQFSMTVKLVGSVHVEFHTTIKTSREVLLSQLGAIVNFYLGFSGLVLITAVVYCTNLGKRWYSQRRRSDISCDLHELRSISSVLTLIDVQGNENVETDRIDRFIIAQEALTRKILRTLEVQQTQLEKLVERQRHQSM